MRPETPLKPLCAAALPAATAVLFSLALLLPCCSDKPSTPAAGGKPVVFVCVPPHAGFARQIADGFLDVRVLVQPGANPHTFEPSAAAMAELSRADLYFRAGMPFEDALIAKLPAKPQGPRIVDLTEGIDLLADADADHDHEHPGEHEGHAAPGPHEYRDPHVWLSPKLAARQVQTMTDALCAKYPDHAATFRNNAAALTGRLAALDGRIATELAPLKGRTFFVYHPAFSYFAAEFGLRQQAVEVGGKSPSLKTTVDLIARAKADGVKVIFVQPQFSATAARTIADEIGGAVVPIDPLAEDYFANMTALAETIHKALAGEAAPAGGS